MLSIAYGQDIKNKTVSTASVGGIADGCGGTIQEKREALGESKVAPVLATEAAANKTRTLSNTLAFTFFTTPAVVPLKKFEDMAVAWMKCFLIQLAPQLQESPPPPPAPMAPIRRELHVTTRSVLV